MRLDQYAYKRKGYSATGKDMAVEEIENVEIAYWRKHPYLEQFMAEKWCDKTGNDEEVFNCQELELTLQDIEELEDLVKDGQLPEGHGFFWGNDSCKEYYDDDIKFIEKAKDALEDGYTIVYSSWW